MITNINCLIDEQEAFVKAASGEKFLKSSTKLILKRKVGYSDEGVSITRTRLAQMKIAEGNEVGRDKKRGEAYDEAGGEGPQM